MKLLADGKSRADVYGQLLPGYLRSQDGPVPGAMCRVLPGAATDEAGESEGVELLASLLTQILIAGSDPAFRLINRLARLTSESPEGNTIGAPRLKTES